nr:putative mediator of RNA polymerase II transcription subunit 24 [Ipomoea batatas]
MRKRTTKGIKGQGSTIKSETRDFRTIRAMEAIVVTIGKKIKGKNAMELRGIITQNGNQQGQRSNGNEGNQRGPRPNNNGTGNQNHNGGGNNGNKNWNNQAANNGGQTNNDGNNNQGRIFIMSRTQAEANDMVPDCFGEWCGLGKDLHESYGDKTLFPRR